jgi:hypothetical protein
MYIYFDENIYQGFIPYYSYFDPHKIFVSYPKFYICKKPAKITSKDTLLKETTVSEN